MRTVTRVLRTTNLSQLVSKINSNLLTGIGHPIPEPRRNKNNNQAKGVFHSQVPAIGSSGNRCALMVEFSRSEFTKKTPSTYKLRSRSTGQ